MSYTCPKCGRTMFSISTASIPPIISYVCYACGYKSKPVFEKLDCADLPKELWSEGTEDEENNN